VELPQYPQSLQLPRLSRHRSAIDEHPRAVGAVLTVGSLGEASKGGAAVSRRG